MIFDLAFLQHKKPQKPQKPNLIVSKQKDCIICMKSSVLFFFDCPYLSWFVIEHFYSYQKVDNIHQRGVQKVALKVPQPK